MLELETHTGLDVLSGVHPIAVESELPHPVGQPLDDVIARSAGVTRAPEERVELGDLATPAPLACPLLEQQGWELNGSIAIGADVGEMRDQIAVHGRRIVLVGAGGACPHPTDGPRRILGRGRAGVVDDRVHDDADAVAVRRIHYPAKVVLGSERRIHGGPVTSPVAVIAVGPTGPLVHASMDLLDEGRHPDRRHAQAVEVPLLDFPEHTGEIPTLEAAQHRAVLAATQGAIVGWIAILEAIDEQEVDGAAIPGMRDRHTRRRSLAGSGCGVAHDERRIRDRSG